MVVKGDATMKKVIHIISIGLLVIAVLTEACLLFNQSNKISSLKNSLATINVKYEDLQDDKNRELSEKVIIETYNQQNKAGKLRSKDDMYIFDILDLRDNMKIISESYTGDDQDIRDMLGKVNIYLNHIWDNRLDIESMSKDERSKYNNQHIKNYRDANEAVNKCISKYALFDKVGLK